MNIRQGKQTMNSGTVRFTVTVSTAVNFVVFTFATKVEAQRFADITEQSIRMDVDPMTCTNRLV